METWKAEKAGAGRYHVRAVKRDPLLPVSVSHRLPGLVIGGGRRWAVELGGRTIGHYSTVRAACAALWSAAVRASVDAERRRLEWLPADDDWTPRGPVVPRPFAGA